jgi:hypothetical protein
MADVGDPRTAQRKDDTPAIAHVEHLIGTADNFGF